MEEKCFTDFQKEVESKVNLIPKNAASLRQLSRKKYSFSDYPLSEQLMIWDYIWHNSVDWHTRTQAYFFCEIHLKNKDFLVSSWECLKNWQAKVSDWGSSDCLSKIYTKILEVIPEKVLTQLEQWNKSTNLWDRRQSVVALLYFSRTKKVILSYDTIIVFIDNLLTDKEYYIQKGVGWALRELYTVYPSQTLEYIKQNIKHISPAAFGAATEKLKIEDKQKLKMKRK
jgi:3-methyladenine DNA glycosylase AlkD